MTTVHLSWFDTVHDWFFDEALDYVFDWISEIWSEAFNLLEKGFNAAVSSAINSAFGSFLSGLMELIFARFYAFLVTVLLVLDCIEDCFDVVAGISPVYRSSGGKSIKMPLLNAIYAESSIQKMIAAIVGIGLVLCIFCAILATVKSMLEADGQQTKPVSHVLRQTSKAMLYFILIPLISSFLLSLSGSILNVVDDAFTGGNGKTTVARTIFAISSLDAIDLEKHPEAYAYNSSYEGDKSLDFGVTDRYRKRFFFINKDDTLPAYANPVLVKETFTFRGLDYVIGIGMGIYFNIVLGMVLFIFICRIFEVIVLLIVEPFFIAMMPLDDGEHFKSWSNLFMGKLFSGFGMVVAMRVYLMISIKLFSNELSFVDPGSNGAAVQNYLIKLLFIAGGALGIRSMGPLITGILSENAAKSEQVQAAIGARMGGSIAAFQKKRFGKLASIHGKRIGRVLKTTGRVVGATSSTALAATAYAGGKAISGIGYGAQKFGGLIKRSFSGSGKSKQNVMQYDGGAPQNIKGQNVLQNDKKNLPLNAAAINANKDAAIQKNQAFSVADLKGKNALQDGGGIQKNQAFSAADLKGKNALQDGGGIQKNIPLNGIDAAQYSGGIPENASAKGIVAKDAKNQAAGTKSDDEIKESVKNIILGEGKGGNILDNDKDQTFRGDKK